MLDRITDQIKQMAAEAADEMMSIDEDNPNYDAAYDHAYDIALTDILHRLLKDELGLK